MMRTSYLRIGLLCLVMASVLLDAAYSQVKQENLGELLQKAKDEFRSKSDELEVKLILAIERKLEVARKTGDKRMIELLQTEREKFEKEGALPMSVEKASHIFQRQMSTARLKLEQIYRSQIKAYVKASQDVEADTLQKELDVFLASELDDLSQAELIRNPGCDDELTPTKDPAWIIVRGKWENQAPDVPAQAGIGFFSPAHSPDAELMQEIDLAKFSKRIDDGLLKFVFKGYVRSWRQDKPDTSRIILEFLETRKKKPLDTFDTGQIASIDRWQLVTDARVAIKGTRWIRIRLQSKRNDGLANDGYYDSLSLKVTSVDNPAASKASP